VSKKLSLHIGMNRVNPTHYGSEARLGGCVNDATAMREIATSNGFRATLLTDAQGTSSAILDYLGRAARDLQAGDSLFISYAGHGSQVPDRNNDEAPNDKDQTWCVYDRMIVDDELAEYWSRFRSGVRILIVSDSCHSATVARNLEIASRSRSTGRPAGALLGEAFGNDYVAAYRTLPMEVAEGVNARHAALYDDLQRQTRGTEATKIVATVVTLSACRDEETAADGRDHGLYTSNLLRIWNKGAYQGNYFEFQKAIAELVKHRQNPQYRIIGSPNVAFEGERPFTTSSTNRKGEKHMDTTTSLDDRLNALKSRSSQPAASPQSDDRCWLELSVPRQYLIDASDEGAYEFLRTEGADALMKTVLSLRDVAIPRNGTRGELSCGISDKGFECKGTIRF